MAGIMLRTTKRRSVVDVHNAVTLINDIYSSPIRMTLPHFFFNSPP